jgi:hypothetical protein
VEQRIPPKYFRTITEAGPVRWNLMVLARKHELSALNGQCLHGRIPDVESMRRQTSACQNHRNNRGVPINRRFTTEDARIKPRRLFPDC